MTLVGVGSVTSDGSLDEKESEELGRLQRQQVNDSSPLLALANGGTNADIVSRTNREYARRSQALQPSSTESFYLVRNIIVPDFSVVNYGIIIIGSLEDTGYGTLGQCNNNKRSTE